MTLVVVLAGCLLSGLWGYFLANFDPFRMKQKSKTASNLIRFKDAASGLNKDAALDVVAQTLEALAVAILPFGGDHDPNPIP